MAQVDIIHGSERVIREGVTKYLRRNKHVKALNTLLKMQEEAEQQLLPLNKQRVSRAF